MTNQMFAYWRRVPPGFRSYEVWAEELGSAAMTSGRAAFIFPNVHRRRQAEEFFLARDGHLPVRLFTPRQFTESLVPPSWVVAEKFGANLLLEKIIGEFHDPALTGSARFLSLRDHAGSRRLLVKFFEELASAGISDISGLKTRLPRPDSEDLVWTALFEKFLAGMDSRQVVFGPMLEGRLARYLLQSAEPLPYRTVRIETGCELDIPDQQVYEALVRRGVDAGIEIPIPGEPSDIRARGIPAWRPALSIIVRLEASGDLWKEIPPVKSAVGKSVADRQRLLDPIDRTPVDSPAAGVFVHLGEPTPVDELHAASERIRLKLAAGNIVPQDTGIVLSDPYSLADRAESVARKYGLPVEVARARTVIETEAGRVTRLLLEVLKSGAEPEALVKFLSSPLVSWELPEGAGKTEEGNSRHVTPRLVREFNAAFDHCRAQGPARVWFPRLKALAERPASAETEGFDGGQRAISDAAPLLAALLGEDLGGTPAQLTGEKLRRGLLVLRPEASAPVRDFSGWVERALWNAWLPRRLTRLSLPDGEGSATTEAVRRSFAGLTKLFDVLGGLVSEAEKLGIGMRPMRDWASDLEELLRETPVPERIPSAKSVRVISPRDVPGLGFRHLEWVGLSENRFPPRRPDRVWGSGAARRALGLDQMVPETELAWARLGLALLETDGEVHLSCPRRDGDDKAVLSSPVWLIRKKLGDTEPAPVSHQLSLERQGAAWLSGFEGEYSGKRDWAAVVKALLVRNTPAEFPAKLLSAEPELNPEAALALSAPGRLSKTFAPDLNAMLTGRPLSATRLGEYARCPFFYLAVTRFKAKRPEERVSGPTPMERGILVHKVLEKFYSDPAVLAVRPHSDWAVKASPRLHAIFDEVAAGYDLVFHGDGWEIEKSRARTLLDRFLVAEGEIKDVSRPVAVELGFGRKGEAPFEWAGLKFSGSIDRVDEVPGQGFLIFDYKTGKKVDDHQTALTGGTGFQLPLYAAAAKELLKGRIPENWLGGGFYELRLPMPSIPKPLMPLELAVRFGASSQGRSDMAKLGKDLAGLEGRYRQRTREIADLVLAGSFPTTPLDPKAADCDRCHLQNVCHDNDPVRSVRNSNRTVYGVISEWKAGQEEPEAGEPSE